MPKLSRVEQNRLSPEEREAYRAQRKIEAAELGKQWRIANRERSNRTQRERRKRNPEKTKNEKRISYVRHADRIKAYAKEYANRNPEKKRERFARYFKKNQAKRLEEWGWKDALRRGCRVGDRSLIVPIYQKAIDMAKETGERWSVDHIIPLALGGIHDAENMQPMPLVLNHTKSGNPFWICEDGRFKDWRDVPYALWPHQFIKTFEAVYSYGKVNFLDSKIA